MNGGDIVGSDQIKLIDKSQGNVISSHQKIPVQQEAALPVKQVVREVNDFPIVKEAKPIRIRNSEHPLEQK